MNISFVDSNIPFHRIYTFLIYLKHSQGKNELDFIFQKFLLVLSEINYFV